ncbi:restriction endonuclease subunit S [Aquipseudomonas campi]|uniref:Restriction endonuclease subunit S n=2 Tax=Aquipseudomonas campi TaxID=2731681 RepID=A0A6M8FEG4_9GAMM|nr:restriction endonuclease subunit S [Pseudomonas campi]
MKAWQGSVGISSHNGIVSPAYHVYAPSHSEAPQYLHHLFRCNEYIAGYLANSKGIRVNQWDLEPQQHSRMSVLLPSFQEQTQIARFLDHETTRIDALIEKQQRLIELLKEKRQAVISHAVTKGLDPTVPMKDSGVEWLGEVPAHWEAWKLNHAFGGIGSGTTPPSAEHGWYDGGTIPWITTSELRESIITTTKKSVTLEALGKFSALQIHPPGSLAIAMYGATIGRLGMLGISATTNQACCVLSNPRSLEPKFTFYWLHGFREVIISLYATGGGQPNISQDTVANLKIPAPDIEEQQVISDFLDQKTIEHDSLVKEAERVVGFLQERRSALISAAVTGKIDVRNWQPTASTQAPELAVAEAD